MSAEAPASTQLSRGFPDASVHWTAFQQAQEVEPMPTAAPPHSFASQQEEPPSKAKKCGAAQLLTPATIEDEFKFLITVFLASFEGN